MKALMIASVLLAGLAAPAMGQDHAGHGTIMAADSAATIDTGVEITSAHGHAMTSRTSARYVHPLASGAPASHGTTPSATAMATTTGV